MSEVFRLGLVVAVASLGRTKATVWIAAPNEAAAADRGRDAGSPG
jgi:hypothetical protein